MAFGLKCPDCRKSFRYDPLQGHPRFCPLCNADMGEEKNDDVISIPAFLSARTKGTDQVYRDIETSSQVRAEKAAEMAGVPVSEMADLKITNLRSTKHEGDIAHVPVVNEVTKQMDAINAKGGQFGFAGSSGAEFAAGISSGAITVDGKVTRGIEPRAGARAIERIQRQFNRIP